MEGQDKQKSVLDSVQYRQQVKTICKEKDTSNGKHIKEDYGPEQQSFLERKNHKSIDIKTHKTR